MLVIHPNSTCDICTDNYSQDKVPAAIPCGHVFCLECVNRLEVPECPLCRGPFIPDAVPKLHIDQSALVQSTSVLSPVTSELPPEAQRFRREITRIAHEGETTGVVQKCLDEIGEWLDTQLSMTELQDLRTSFVLLLNNNELQREADSLYEQIKVKCEAAERECAGLRKVIAEEKRLLENSQKAEREWKMKHDLARSHCELLENGLAWTARESHRILSQDRLERINDLGEAFAGLLTSAKRAFA